jgi:diadenosine tetraphosphate (Ap4A) HIT family hydrolase
MKIKSLFLFVFCLGLVKTELRADEFSLTKDLASLVKVIINKNYSSQYSIECVMPVAHINDIDLGTVEGKKLASAIVLACLELSKFHNDADFTLHISSKRDRMINTVTFYPPSTYTLNTACVFCDRSRFGGDIIAENSTTIAFEKDRPARNPINFLIVPKKHVINYKDNNFTPEVFINQLAMAQELSKKLTDNRVDLYINNGSSAAQSVFHSHMHFRSPAEWK